MRYLRWAGAIFLLLLSLATWVPRIRIAGVGPDLLFGVVFVFALQRGATWGAWVGVLLGLLIGVEQPEVLGRDCLALSLAGLFIGRASIGLDRDNPLVQLGLLFTGAVVADLVRMFGLVAGDPLAAPIFLVRWVLPGALYTTIVWPLLLLGFRFVLGQKGWMPGAP
jgi:rod shape-determining protein MreD